MTRILRIIFVTAVMLVFGVASRAADTASPPVAPSHDLLCHATSGQMWIARVSPDPYGVTAQAVKTRIWIGTPGSNGMWLPLDSIPARAVDLANLSSELAVLLDTGEWVIASPSGNRTGPPPPNGAILRDLSSRDDDLWALADVPGGLAPGPTTRPSFPAWNPTTTPANDDATPSMSAPATQPSVAAMPSVPVVFRFADGRWEAVAPQLPLDVVRGATQYSLVIVNRQPSVAFDAPDHTVHVLTMSPDHAWLPLATIPSFGSQPDFKLLTDQTSLALWAGTDSPGGTLFTGANLSDPWPLTVQGQLPGKIDARSATFGANYYRVVLTSGDQAWQQTYDADKREAGLLQPIVLPVPAGISVTPFVIGGAVITIVATVAALVQRKPLTALASGAVVETVTLAPLSARLIAGAVDALPLIIAFLVAANSDRTDESAQEFMVRIQLPWIVATAAYLLHTTLAEAIAGASLAKLMFGLRVVNAQGMPASLGSRVSRNLLRILDVIFVFPLVSVFFSPLRQRIGDIAAGTTVVLQQPNDDEDED
jgi:uncharacterized RDD family membrane protein YckC